MPEPNERILAQADDCCSCGEGMPEGECAESRRTCGHHCDHSWSHDACHWCGKQFGEAEQPAVDRFKLQVAAERVTDPDWPDHEQEALKWLYEGAVDIGGSRLHGTLLSMLQEHINAERRAATAAHDAEAKLARWKPIIRAALGEREAEEALRAVFHLHGRRGASQEAADIINTGQRFLRERRDKRADAVDALSEEERAEILEEGGDG